MQAKRVTDHFVLRRGIYSTRAMVYKCTKIYSNMDKRQTATTYCKLE